MSYSNGLLSDQSYQTANKYVQRGLPGVGFKLTVMGDYDMQNKKLTNVKSGTDSNDAVNKSQLDVTTNLLHGSRAGDVVNDKAVIYSNTGAVHANSLYIEDPSDQGNSNEVRIMTEHQSYPNIHLNIPDLHNFDGHGGRPKSELMVTSVEQTVMGKKVFENIEVHDPTSNNQAANKSYADTKLSLTGGTMTGDLILPHHNYPIPGNTNKVINYESQREIFLSRQESFPMLADINMNNNFIQNIATPTSSHQATNKGYCDYNFLSRQKGGVLMSSLSMNQNDLFEIPAPKYGNSAVNKNYIDTEITKVHQNLDLTPFLRKDGQRAMTGSLNMNGNQIIRLKEPVSSSDASTKGYTDRKIDNIQKIDTTLFIKKDGSVPMAADLDMGTHKIINVGQPTTDTDAASKGYIDNTLAESHLISSHKSNEFKYLDDPNETSSEYNITIDAFTDFNESPHKNKKAFQITLTKDAGTNDYRSRMGFNLYPLPLGTYTIIFEYYFPENTNIQLSCQSTTAYVHKQIQKDFTDYSKLLVQINNNSKTTPDYLFFTIHGTAVVNNPEGYIIVYGVKDWSDSVDPNIYDDGFYVQMFQYKNGDMQIQTEIDMNTHKIENLSDATNTKDAINKGQLDTVDVNLETFKNQINTFKFYFKNYLYMSIFTYRFYDLKEPSTFIFDGAAISGINPNMSIISSGSSHITVSGFDPIRGLQFNSATRIIIDLGYMVNQNSPYTIMISLTIKDSLHLHFVDPANHQSYYYPGYVVNPSDHSIRVHVSPTVFKHRGYSAVFDNKQTMIWIYFNPSERKYEIIIGNGNFSYVISNPVSNFSTNKLRIDAYNNIINKICYQNQFIALGETFIKMMFEERKNGSYF